MSDDSKPMTPEEFARRMRECSTGDPERDHSMADDLMCEALRSLGYEEGVKVFGTIEMWCA